MPSRDSSRLLLLRCTKPKPSDLNLLLCRKLWRTKMKKFFSIAMVAVMLVALCSTVFAAASATFTVGTVDAYKGESDTVVVPVTVSDNSGFMAAKFTVSYDNTQLSLESVDFSNSFAGTVVVNGNSVVWTNAKLQDNKSNDVLANLTFKVLDTSADAKYDVTITAINASNYDEQTVDITAVAGAVNVTDKPVVTTTTAPAPATTTAAPAPATTTAGNSGKKDSPKTADAGVAVAAVALAAAACFVATKKRK
ncbi:MAG: hypothetical protein DBX45_09705 [Oscillospiraceae bacterium]|nr:MAG: hypothetical protein DBX45_09705 [Oscillospiraceae bacterium]